jgi:hypothetical protein
MSNTHLRAEKEQRQIQAKNGSNQPHFGQGNLSLPVFYDEKDSALYV